MRWTSVIILFPDIARPHVARMTLQKLTDLRYETVPHPLYSPILSPAGDYFVKHLTIFNAKKIPFQGELEKYI